MITLRMMSTALLWNSRDELLMMKRSMTRTLSPGLWAAIGGHLEPSELNNPRAACLREIYEETGIEHDEIRDLSMRYILLRLNGLEVRQQFFYVGYTDVNPRITTAEGDLHWVPRELVLERPLPFIFRSLLEHYFTAPPASHPWTGSAGVSEDSGLATIHWHPLVDPMQV